jgi:hypothetical protein
MHIFLFADELCLRPGTMAVARNLISTMFSPIKTTSVLVAGNIYEHLFCPPKHRIHGYRR